MAMYYDPMGNPVDENGNPVPPVGGVAALGTQSPVPPPRPESMSALSNASSSPNPPGYMAGRSWAPAVYNQVNNEASLPSGSPDEEESPLSQAQSDDSSDDSENLGVSSILGRDKDIASALQRHQDEITSTTQQKANAIQQAIANMTRVKQGQTMNLPLLAWGSALMGPTVTGSFGEGLSNAARASIPLAEQERTSDIAYQQQLGQLGISAADLDVQRAKDASSQFQLYLKQIEDERYRSAIQQQNLDYRKSMLGIRHQQADAGSERTLAYTSGRGGLSPNAMLRSLDSAVSNAPSDAARVAAMADRSKFLADHNAAATNPPGGAAPVAGTAPIAGSAANTQNLPLSSYFNIQ